MYRQQISRKTSSLFNRTTVSRKQSPTPSYEPLSWVVRRAQQDPKSLSGDEWQQLESAISTRAVREILAGKKTPWVPDLKRIAEQLGVVSGTEVAPIQAKSKEDVSQEEKLEEPKKPWIPEFKGISSQLLADTMPMNPPIQAKLTIGEVGDKYEREADRVAKEVVQQINRPAPDGMTQGEVLQGKASEEEEELRKKPMPDLTELEEEEEELQRKAKVQPQEAIGGREASKDLEVAIKRARGGGQPLDAGLQQSMGEAMGADFSGVRVHTDAQADQLNQSLEAKAFTTGQDMFFRQGEYQPGSRGGQEMIAHELTHVVQQNGGAVQRKPQSPKQLTRPLDTETTSASGREGVLQEKKEQTGEDQGIPAELARKEQREAPEVPRTDIGASEDKADLNFKTTNALHLQRSTGNRAADQFLAGDSHDEPRTNLGMGLLHSIPPMQGQIQLFKDQDVKNRASQLRQEREGTHIDVYIEAKKQVRAHEIYRETQSRNDPTADFLLAAKEVENAWTLWTKYKSNKSSKLTVKEKEILKKGLSEEEYKRYETLIRDKDIKITKRVGKGNEADGLRIKEDETKILGVAFDTRGDFVNDPQGYPLCKDLTGKEDVVVGSASKNQVGWRYGDWINPVDLKYYAPYYAIAVPTVKTNDGWITKGENPQQKDCFLSKEKTKPIGHYTLPYGYNTDCMYGNIEWLGAVHKDKVKLITFVETEKDQKFAQRQESLFPHEPKLEDVKQGGLADCALLAVLVSVVAFKPNFIKGMMTDNQDGTVTVSFFDVKHEENKKEFTKRKVTVQKTVVVNEKNEEYFANSGTGGGALWVPILEKAYVAARYLGTSREVTPSPSYGNIESVLMEIAFEHVLGKEAKSSELTQKHEKRKRGRGSYTKEEVQLFNKIKEALKKGNFITVETEEKIVDDKKCKSLKGIGGEPYAKGLVGAHAYAVMKTYTYNLKKGNDRIGQRLYVELVNPWGWYGRKYTWENMNFNKKDDIKQYNLEQKKAVASEQNEGKFKIELSDMVKRFKKIAIL